ncbi:MFS transporter [Amycolatopsis roodepoortensis]|uniref:MFS family permease n=1 Tax=Amycolatopsis roodepoortensis TaxID=700274 RepID=A0ABR9L198_9PSEU|nr:MFS transporter [Amycolatopsis roodepoortensis]MBE1574387.1 MFS family permease [Amycolatopsis roodepoortensis]
MLGAEVGESTVSPGGRRVRVVLAVDQLLVALGLFSLFPVLGVMLASRGSASNAALVGVGLFCYTASAGLSALLLNRWLPRLSYRHGMAGSALLSAVAFGLLPYVRAGWVLCGLLVLAGLGVSVHFVLSRVFVAELVRDDIGRNRIYSLLQIAVNAAAAVGPLVASVTFAVDPRLLLAFVSLCYVGGAASLCFAMPSREYPPSTSGRWPVSRAVLGRALRSAEIVRVLVVCVVGAFVYAQFFSAFALFVADSVSSVALRAGLLAAPAILIVLLQAAVTKVVTRLLEAGVKPFTVLGAGTMVFGVAMLFLGAGLPLVAGAVLAAAMFSLAEMLFTPMVSTAFAGLPIESSLESFNLRQVCWTVGEALGSLAGGGLYLWLRLRGEAWLYWHLLAWPTLAGIGVLLVVSARRRA